MRLKKICQKFTLNNTKVFLLKLTFCFPVLFLCLSKFAIAEEVTPRTILALYDSQEEFNHLEDNNLIHDNAEMVLNYLGMKVRYHDIATGLPETDALDDVCAILTWFRDEKMHHPDEYLKWAIGQIRTGKKYIIIENPGFLADVNMSRPKTNFELVNSLFNLIGLEYRGNWTDNPYVLEVVEKNKEMVEFERTLDNEIGGYEQYISVDSENRSYLRLNRTDIDNGVSEAVVVTKNGGFVQEGYALFLDYYSNQKRWRINPFQFFSEALKINDFPRLDTATLFGRRIFYSHIDGDGIRNLSETGNNITSGEVIRDQILKKFDLPITASVVTAEIDPQYLGNDRMVQLAKSIFELPNIEIGVHSFSHPLNWSNQIVSLEINNYAKVLSKEEVEKMDLPSESVYQNGARVLKNHDEFLYREIQGSIEYVNNNLAPEDKRVSIFQWTGNCQPTADAIEMVNRLGIANINGGDSRFDSNQPSYTNIAPLTRQNLGRFQFYSSNANENIYTIGWKAPYDRFEHVIETFQQTERPALIKTKPRRTNPINIYYHYFSGEKIKSIEALKKVYDYALGQNIIPIFTSEYIRVVWGFMNAKISKMDDGGWRFVDFGKCRTIRVDETGSFPDFNKSKGIVGFTKWEDYLYIHLNNQKEAVLYLSNQKPDSPYLSESSAIVSDVSFSDEKITFTTHGIGEAFYRWHLPNTKKNYEITSYNNRNNKIETKKIKTSSDGTLTFVTSLKNVKNIEIKPTNN